MTCLCEFIAISQRVLCFRFVYDEFDMIGAGWDCGGYMEGHGLDSRLPRAPGTGMEWTQLGTEVAGMVSDHRDLRVALCPYVPDAIQEP